MQTPDAPSSALESEAADARGSAQRLVLKNTAFLLVAQALSMPLSVLVNAVTGRYLGAEEFGLFYLATTFSSFGFLFAEWGQGGALPAMLARNRQLGSVLLGTGLVQRIGAGVLVYGVLALLVWLLGHGSRFQLVLGLVVLSSACGHVLSTYYAVIRGFERSDLIAYAQVGSQLLFVVFTVAALLLGGRLISVLVLQIVPSLVVLVFVARAMPRLGIDRLRFDSGTLKTVVAQGTPFMFLGLTMALQPNIDAVFLSRLAPPEVMGWHAAALKLMGVLAYPAIALISALYPTLVKLYHENMDEYLATARGAVRSVTILVVPLALCSYLFADIGVSIFGDAAFGPAVSNVRVFSGMLFLVYFSMTLGICLMAAGRQKIWSVVQTACVLVSAVLDPLLIPYFQRHYGNGGLGIGVAAISSEVVMLTAAMFLIPKGVIEPKLLRQLALAGLAGTSMLCVHWLMRGLSSFVIAPVALVAYVVVLKLTGGVDDAQLAMLRSLVSRKKRAPAPSAG